MLPHFRLVEYIQKLLYSLVSLRSYFCWFFFVLTYLKIFSLPYGMEDGETVMYVSFYLTVDLFLVQFFSLFRIVDSRSFRIVGHSGQTINL